MNASIQTTWHSLCIIWFPASHSALYPCRVLVPKHVSLWATCLFLHWWAGVEWHWGPRSRGNSTFARDQWRRGDEHCSIGLAVIFVGTKWKLYLEVTWWISCSGQSANSALWGWLIPGIHLGFKEARQLLLRKITSARSLRALRRLDA